MKHFNLIIKNVLGIFSRLLCILGIICILVNTSNFDVYASQAPTRMINVVYDDSGSMYTGVDTWCQAKYSMEVFAAMLSSTDKMNVYYMSDFTNGTSAKPKITLDGRDGAAVNVSKVHKQTTVANNTPFNSVKKAYSDLSKVKADEKWLIILTDGEFEDGKMSKGKVDAFLAKKNKNIKVMFLGMGPKATGITEKTEKNIYYVEAKTNNQILNRITEICTRVFNSNKLEVNVNSKTFSFDVPMSELIVFAQGANVNINGIKNENGSVIKNSQKPVEVKYSKCDAKNYSNPPTTDLLGKIATYTDDFKEGSYIADVSGAETIEIYYKPNVEVAAYLSDKNGENVEDLSNLAAGDYTITFGFVKAGTSEKVTESKLLGEISYSATVTNNGVRHKKKYDNGDKITLEEGDLTIDITANYLDYNSVSTNLSYNIFKDKKITFSFENNPNYTVISEGLIGDDVIKIRAQIDGGNFTEKQWEKMDIPQVVLVDEDREFDIELSQLEKDEEPGIFNLKPALPGGKPSTGTYCDTQYKIKYQQKIGSETWKGKADGILKLQDDRAWLERNRDLLFKSLIVMVLLAILFGYLPFVKHYLPKSLKKKPYIKCIPSEPGEKRKDRNGLVEKNLLSTIIPYISQKATIKYVPKGVTGCPAMAVKAIKGRRMALTNVKAFAGKDYITFDGESIKKDTKKFETGAGVSIRAKRGEWTYTCSPNQTN